MHCTKRIQHKQNRFLSRRKPNGTEKQFKYTIAENFSENKEELILQTEREPSILRKAGLLKLKQSSFSYWVSKIWIFFFKYPVRKVEREGEVKNQGDLKLLQRGIQAQKVMSQYVQGLR